jgi:hypothetical protein
MPARRPGIEIALQKAFYPRAGGNFVPLSDESVALVHSRGIQTARRLEKFLKSLTTG